MKRAGGESCWGRGGLALAGLLVAGTVHAQSAPQPPRSTGAARERTASVAVASTAARLYLDYQRGPGAHACASAEQLAAAVEERLGRRVFVPASEAELHAQLRAQRVGRGYRVALQLYDRERRPLGRRQLSTRARHCSALDEALALVLSLAADVALPAPSSAASPVPSVPPPVLPLPLDTPLEIPADVPAPRQPWLVRPSLGLTVQGGLLPGAALAGSLELELGPPRSWPFWLRASLFLDERTGAATGGEFSAQALELGVCPWAPRGERFEARLCVQQLLGLVGARGFGSDADRQEPRVSLALGLEQSVGYRIGDWFISVSGSLLATPARRRYYLVDGDEITLHEQGWVWGGGRLALGLEL